MKTSLAKKHSGSLAIRSLTNTAILFSVLTITFTYRAPNLVLAVEADKTEKTNDTKNDPAVNSVRDAKDVKEEPNGSDEPSKRDKFTERLRSQSPNQTKTVVDPVQAERDKRARDAAKARGEITFEDLKFDIDKDGEFEDQLITESIQALSGKTVRIRGFILPSYLFQQKGFNRFVLVRDNQECCFGPGAALFDCLMVEMEGSRTADFTTRMVTVKGTFSVDTKTYRYPDSEQPFAVFKIVATEVK